MRRILLIDDHPFIREGLKAIIDRLGGYLVVGEAGDALEGLNLAKRLTPKVVLLDISLPDQSGLALIQDLKKNDARVVVLIISMHSSKQSVMEAFLAGADGYITKDSATTKLAIALDTILNGKRYCPEGVTQEMIDEHIFKFGNSVNSGNMLILTKREKQVMRLIAKGDSTKTIGDKLFISVKTVESHRRNLMLKLNLSSTADVILYALRTEAMGVDG